MTTLNSLEGLIVLKNNSTEYKGNLTGYQQGSPKEDIKTIVQKEFTPYQNMLYRRAIYGLDAYSQKELGQMHWEKRRRIKRVSIKANKSINLLKQERMNLLCHKLYKELFPKSKLAKNVFSLEKSVTDPNIINNLELGKLGITKHVIIKRLVSDRILPKNFYKLKQAV